MHIAHEPGELFTKSGYDRRLLEEDVKLICKGGDLYFSSAVFERIRDLDITPVEVINSILNGNIKSSEVTPSRSEIRMEFIYETGDMKDKFPVIYLSSQHILYCEDIR